MISRENLLEQKIREKDKEIERLHSIIKEVREYITTEQLYTDYQWSKEQYKKILKDILEILDKENK